MTTRLSFVRFKIVPQAFRQRIDLGLICVSLCTMAQGAEPGAFNIGTQSGSGIHYTLSDGVLATSGTTVGPNGTFDHMGGLHEVMGELKVEGGLVLSGGGAAYAFYTLTGGTLESLSARITVAVFSQSGGTNRTGELVIGPHNAQCTFNLSAGRLETVNSILSGSWRGGLNQSGGAHVVAERLRILGDSFHQPTYRLTGGELSSGEIEICRGTLVHQGGEVAVAGAVILDAGVWEESSPSQALGPLQVAETAGGGSVLRLAGGIGVLHFADSSARAWAGEAQLMIEGWNGSMRGGGTEQVLFGNSAAGLSAAQLAQVQFKDPGGCPPGVYRARILPSGEIVPGPFLHSVMNGSTITLEWDAGFALQSSLHPAGPFEDVLGAASPYVTELGAGQRFFRLRE